MELRNVIQAILHQLKIYHSKRRKVKQQQEISVKDLSANLVLTNSNEIICSITENTNVVRELPLQDYLFYSPEYLVSKCKMVEEPSVVIQVSEEKVDVFSLGMICVYYANGILSFSDFNKNYQDLLVEYLFFLGLPPNPYILSLHAMDLNENQLKKIEKVIVKGSAGGRVGNVMSYITGLSLEARDFILKCLCWDVNERFSIDEALLHPFISSNNLFVMDKIHPALHSSLQKKKNDLNNRTSSPFNISSPSAWLNNESKVLSNIPTCNNYDVKSCWWEEVPKGFMGSSPLTQKDSSSPLILNKSSPLSPNRSSPLYFGENTFSRNKGNSRDSPLSFKSNNPIENSPFIESIILDDDLLDDIHFLNNEGGFTPSVLSPNREIPLINKMLVRDKRIKSQNLSPRKDYSKGFLSSEKKTLRFRSDGKSKAFSPVLKYESPTKGMNEAPFVTKERKEISQITTDLSRLIDNLTHKPSNIEKRKAFSSMQLTYKDRIISKNMSSLPRNQHFDFSAELAGSADKYEAIADEEASPSTLSCSPNGDSISLKVEKIQIRVEKFPSLAVCRIQLEKNKSKISSCFGKEIQLSLSSYSGMKMAHDLNFNHTFTCNLKLDKVEIFVIDLVSNECIARSDVDVAMLQHLGFSDGWYHLNSTSDDCSETIGQIKITIKKDIVGCEESNFSSEKIDEEEENYDNYMSNSPSSLSPQREHLIAPFLSSLQQSSILINDKEGEDEINREESLISLVSPLSKPVTLSAWDSLNLYIKQRAEDDDE